MSKQLTDADINQVKFLKSKRLTPSQISTVTGVRQSKVKRILAAKILNPKNKYNYLFDWSEWKGGIIV